MAVAFTVLSVLETQDKTIWADSPWKDDPYHTAVFLAPFAVAMLTGSWRCGCWPAALPGARTAPGRWCAPQRR